MTQRRSYRALVVEDDRAILSLVKRVLERENFVVEGVKEASAAIELLRDVAYDLLIVDLMLSGERGDKVLAYLEENQTLSLRRVIVTTASPRQLTCEFLQKICHILEKPFDINRLVLLARECLDPETA